MMFLIINITLIFSLNHLEKHRMKCFKKSSKISKNKCIPPVYHVYVTTSKQRKLSSIYEYSDNSFVISIHKEKPRKFNISRTSQYNLYLRNSRLANTLCKHSLSTGIQYSWGFQTFLYITRILLSHSEIN